MALQWRHNDHDGVSNHQPRDCLLNRLFRRRSKKTSKLRVTGLCEGNSPGTGEFPAQMASYAQNVSIWWRHHGLGVVEFGLSQPNTVKPYESINQSIVTAFLSGMTPLVLWIWNLTWYHKNSFIYHWSQIVLCAKIYCTGSKQITNRIIRCLQICTL